MSSITIAAVPSELSNFATLFPAVIEYNATSSAALLMFTACPTVFLTNNCPNEPVPANEPLILRPLKSKASIFAKPSPLCKNLNIFYNIRPSGTEPLLRVNLQYDKRNIKVNVLKKLKSQIIKVISNAC